MDFTSYASTTSTSVVKSSNIHNKNNNNYDHYTDPYIRRYHIIKIGLQSLSVGLMGNLTKKIIQNIRNRKFYRLSPWLQLCLMTGVFYYGLSQKFDLENTNLQQLKALNQFKQGHYFNSQYWH